MCPLREWKAFLLKTHALVCLCSNQLVNQFPYEASIIRKDLLPQTLRRFNAAELEPDAQAAAASDSRADFFPSWFPATYDLATEPQFFLQDYRQVRQEHTDMPFLYRPVCLLS